MSTAYEEPNLPEEPSRSQIPIRPRRGSRGSAGGVEQRHGQLGQLGLVAQPVEAFRLVLPLLLISASVSPGVQIVVHCSGLAPVLFAGSPVS